MSSGITEYAALAPGWITAGHDGNLWFTSTSGGYVGSITTAGVVTTYTCTPSRNVCLVFAGISLRNCLLPKRGPRPREGRTYVPTRSFGSHFHRPCPAGAAR